MEAAMVALDAQVYQIDFNNRYIMVLEFPLHTSREIMAHSIDRAVRLLNDWKASDKSFLVLGLIDGVKLHLERVNGADTEHPAED